MRGEIDGVIERGAAWAGGRARNGALRANRAARTADCCAVHLGFVQRVFEPADRTGEILQKLDVGAEADDEGLVISFGTDIELLQDFTSSISRLKHEIGRAHV